MEYLLEPHTAIITGATNCDKTYYVMNLLMNGVYKNYFDVVIVLCPTFLHNKTYMKHYDKTFGAKKNLKNSHKTFFYYWHFSNRSCNSKVDYLGDAIDKFSKMFEGCGEILFIVDDFAADAGIVKKRATLGELAMSGRHTRRSLWVLTQKYNSVGKDVREQSRWLCTFYCKDIESLKNMLYENYVEMNKTDRERAISYLINNKRAKLLLKCFQPVGYTKTQTCDLVF